MIKPFFASLVARADCTACRGSGTDAIFGGDCAMCIKPEGRTPSPTTTTVVNTTETGNAMSNFWDDEEVQAAVTSGQWVKFTNVGDVKEGVIAALDKRVFDAGTAKERTAIEITYVDESVMTAGQVKLMQTLVELRPEVGDTLTVELAEIEKRGSKTLKHFIVTHVNSEGESYTVDQTAA
jgi:hypothetical protein